MHQLLAAAAGEDERESPNPGRCPFSNLGLSKKRHFSLLEKKKRFFPLPSTKKISGCLLAFLRAGLGSVRAVEELPVEELDADHGEDEEEEDVDDEDVEHVLERDHDAVEDGLKGGHPVHHLERPEHAQQLDRLELLAGGRAAVERKEGRGQFPGLGESDFFVFVSPAERMSFDFGRL